MWQNTKTGYYLEYLVDLLNKDGNWIGSAFVPAFEASTESIKEIVERRAMERFQPAKAELSRDSSGALITRTVYYKAIGLDSEDACPRQS